MNSISQLRRTPHFQEQKTPSASSTFITVQMKEPFLRHQNNVSCKEQKCSVAHPSILPPPLLHAEYSQRAFCAASKIAHWLLKMLWWHFGRVSLWRSFLTSVLVFWLILSLLFCSKNWICATRKTSINKICFQSKGLQKMARLKVCGAAASCQWSTYGNFWCQLSASSLHLYR